MSRGIAGRWAACCLGLAGLALGVVRAQEPAPALPTRPVASYPNFLIEISKDFANALTQTQSQTVTTPIDTNKDKVHTRGTQTTQIHAHVDFVESASGGRIELLLSGVTVAQTDSQRGRVYLGNAVQISTQSHKSVIVDENGVHEYVAQTQPHLDMNRLRYLDTSFRFPIDLLQRGHGVFR